MAARSRIARPRGVPRQGRTRRRGWIRHPTRGRRRGRVSRHRSAASARGRWGEAGFGWRGRPAGRGSLRARSYVRELGASPARASVRAFGLLTSCRRGAARSRFLRRQPHRCRSDTGTDRVPADARSSARDGAVGRVHRRPAPVHGLLRRRSHDRRSTPTSSSSACATSTGDSERPPDGDEVATSRLQRPKRHRPARIPACSRRARISRAHRCQCRTVPAATRTTRPRGPAPDAVHGPLEKGESLARAFYDGRDQPATRRELLHQRRRDVGAGRRDEIRS